MWLNYREGKCTGLLQRESKCLLAITAAPLKRIGSFTRSPCSQVHSPSRPLRPPLPWCSQTTFSSSLDTSIIYPTFTSRPSTALNRFSPTTPSPKDKCMLRLLPHIYNTSTGRSRSSRQVAFLSLRLRFHTPVLRCDMENRSHSPLAAPPYRHGSPTVLLSCPIKA